MLRRLLASAHDLGLLIRRVNFGPHGNLWFAGIVAALTLILFLAALRRHRSLPKIVPPADRDGVPDCMVIIPARNEEARIESAVRSLPPDTVIVVDDHSEDKTAEVARQAGAGVLPAPPLPRNGVGKPSACAAGARLLTSRWILFADADTRYEKGFLQAVVDFAEKRDLTLVSIHLDPEYQTFFERFLLPYTFALFYSSWISKNSVNPLFTGKCILARREAYVFMGGHGAIATQLVDDVRLTMLAHRHRLNVAVARAPGIGRVRMYQGLRGIWTGIQRQAFRYMVVSPGASLSTFFAWLCMMLWIPGLAWLILGGHGSYRHGFSAIAFTFLPALALAGWYRNWRALLAPLTVVLALPILFWGFISVLICTPLNWKGRTVRAV